MTESQAMAQVNVRDRVLAADRYRTPATSEYIDLYEQLMLDNLDDAAAAKVGPRFVELEEQLRRSLGARPAWEDEIEARTTTESETAPTAIEREPVGSARR
jgi:hypothetical protein